MQTHTLILCKHGHFDMWTRSCFNFVDLEHIFVRCIKLEMFHYRHKKVERPATWCNQYKLNKQQAIYMVLALICFNCILNIFRSEPKLLLGKLDLVMQENWKVGLLSWKEETGHMKGSWTATSIEHKTKQPFILVEFISSRVCIACPIAPPKTLPSFSASTKNSHYIKVGTDGCMPRFRARTSPVGTWDRKFWLGRKKRKRKNW